MKRKRKPLAGNGNYEERLISKYPFKMKAIFRMEMKNIIKKDKMAKFSVIPIKLIEPNLF